MRTCLLIFVLASALAVRPAPAQTATATPTFNNIGIELTFPSPPATGAVDLFIKEAGGPLDYRRGHPLSRISTTRFAGSVMQVEAGTPYSIKLASPLLASNLFLTVTTRENRFPDATNNTFHVAPATGSDGNTGRSFGQAFRMLAKGLSVAYAGDKVLLYSGRYYEGDLSAPRSGTPSLPIIIENAPGQTPILDGTDTNFVPSWVVYDAGNGVYRTATTRQPENAYINGVHFFHYLDLEDLRANRWAQPGGYFADGANLYARFPGGGAPGTNQVTIPAWTTGLSLDSRSCIQIRGIEFCYYGDTEFHRAIYINSGSSNLVDRCRFHHNGIGVAIKRSSNFNTIQYCHATETPLPEWDWHAIKEGGVGYEAGGVVVYGSTETNVGNVIRYNVFTNMFDGSHLYSDNSPQPTGPTANMDFHNNLISNCGDDGIETDGAGVNVRIYNNRFDRFLTGISVAPAAVGPTYIFRNVLSGWHPAAEYDGYPFKFNVSSSLPIQRIHLYHNTCFTDVAGQNGFLFKNYSNWTNIVSRNNIYAGTTYALESWSTVNPVDFDYDNLRTTSASQFIGWAGTNYASVSAFAAATGQETHGLSLPPAFADAAAGDFYLTTGSGLIDKGALIPGINDDYVGAGPDLGAFEFGARAKGLSAAGSRVAVDWIVAGPATCQLQGTTNLVQSAWTNIGIATNAENPVLQLADEDLAGSARFYRLTRIKP